MQIPLTKSFSITHEMPDGTIFEGKFTCHKLAMLEKASVGGIMSRLFTSFTRTDKTAFDQAVIDVANIPKSYVDYAEAIAYCMVAIDEAEVKIGGEEVKFDPENIQDDALLWKVYREVAALETAIFRHAAEKANREKQQSTAQKTQAEKLGGQGQVSSVV